MDIFALQLLNKMISKRYITLGQIGFDEEDGFNFWCASSEEDFMGKVCMTSINMEDKLKKGVYIKSYKQAEKKDTDSITMKFLLHKDKKNRNANAQNSTSRKNTQAIAQNHFCRKSCFLTHTLVALNTG